MSLIRHMPKSEILAENPCGRAASVRRRMLPAQECQNEKHTARAHTSCELNIPSNHLRNHVAVCAPQRFDQFQKHEIVMKHPASAMSHLAQRMLPERVTALRQQPSITSCSRALPHQAELSGALSSFSPCLVAAGALHRPHQGMLHIAARLKTHFQPHNNADSPHACARNCKHLVTRIQAEGGDAHHR